MEFGFLFWLFFIGLIVACLQDLKRREVDNWLNLFLLVSGLVFIFFGAVLDSNVEIVFLTGFFLVGMFLIMNLFYYGRVFAGGDAKLLFAMTAFFIASTFWQSVINVGIFILFLMLSGSFYGLFYSCVLWFKNRKKVNREMGKLVAKNRWLVFVVLVSCILMLFGFVNFVFLVIGVCLFIFPFLYVFAKGLENISMVRKVSGKDLREGDWLVKDILLRKSEVRSRSLMNMTRTNQKLNIIKADWDGLSLEDIEILKKRKMVLIKEGLPFVPAFLIAFLGYVFLKDWFLGLFFI